MAHNIKFGSHETPADVQPDQSLTFKNDQRVPSTSYGSGTIVQDDGDSDPQSTSLGSPASGGGLDLINLGMHKLTLDNDSGEITPGLKTGRYVSPHLRGNRSLDTATFAQSQSGSHVRDFLRGNRSRAVTTGYGRPTGGYHRNSHSWMSQEAQAHLRKAQSEQQIEEEYLIIRNSMRRLFKESHVAKWKLEDYLKHREEMIELQKKREVKRCITITEGPAVDYCYIAPEIYESLRLWGLTNGNFSQEGNRGRVLGELTIWCSDWTNGKDEISPWPTLAEMKWEGDDRAKTNVGRFPPLPREKGPVSLSWNQLPVIEQYPLDQVCKIPTMEDVYLPVDHDIEPEKEFLWSEELDEAISASLDD